MRILILGSQFERGALELLQRDLATKLNNFGATVITVYTNSDPKKKKIKNWAFYKKVFPKFIFWT